MIGHETHGLFHSYHNRSAEAWIWSWLFIEEEQHLCMKIERHETGDVENRGLARCWQILQEFALVKFNSAAILNYNRKLVGVMLRSPIKRLSLCNLNEREVSMILLPVPLHRKLSRVPNMAVLLDMGHRNEISVFLSIISGDYQSHRSHLPGRKDGKETWLMASW